jgi:hypothetical protein
MSRYAPEFTPDMAALLRPEQGLDSRNLPGGTGHLAVAQALAAAKLRLGEMIL